MLHDLAHLGISPAEKAVRTVAVYAALVILLHLAGKRQLASLNSFDLVVLMLLSNIVQNAVIGNDNSLLGGLLGAAIVLAVNWVVVRGALLSPRFGKALQGGAAVVSRDGGVDRRTLRRLGITEEELVAGLRRQGLELSETLEVKLEPEGTFNATPRPKPSLDDVMARLDAIGRRLGA